MMKTTEHHWIVGRTDGIVYKYFCFVFMSENNTAIFFPNNAFLHTQQGFPQFSAILDISVL